MKLALVDGDMVAFRVAAGMAARDQFDFGEGEVVVPAAPTMREEQRANRLVVAAMMDIQTALPECRLFVAVSPMNRKCFRQDIEPTYKAGRAAHPPLLASLKGFLKNAYGAVEREGLEADDVIGIKATSPGVEATVVSNDKDFLQLGCAIYNPHHKDGPHQHYPAHEHQAEYNWLRQVLVGDSCDNYKGCPSIGPVKAEKILKPHYGNLEAMWDAVVQTFGECWLDEAEALKQARLARILRYGEWSPKTGVKLWTPPWKPASPKSVTPAPASPSTPALAVTPVKAKAASTFSHLLSSHEMLSIWKTVLANTGIETGSLVNLLAGSLTQRPAIYSNTWQASPTKTTSPQPDGTSPE